MKPPKDSALAVAAVEGAREQSLQVQQFYPGRAGYEGLAHYNGLFGDRPHLRIPAKMTDVSG